MTTRPLASGGARVTATFSLRRPPSDSSGPNLQRKVAGPVLLGVADADDDRIALITLTRSRFFTKNLSWALGSKNVSTSGCFSYFAIKCGLNAIHVLNSHRDHTEGLIRGLLARVVDYQILPPLLTSDGRCFPLGRQNLRLLAVPVS